MTSALIKEDIVAVVYHSLVIPTTEHIDKYHKVAFSAWKTWDQQWLEFYLTILVWQTDLMKLIKGQAKNQKKWWRNLLFNEYQETNQRKAKQQYAQKIWIMRKAFSEFRLGIFWATKNISLSWLLAHAWCTSKATRDHLFSFQRSLAPSNRWLCRTCSKATCFQPIAQKSKQYLPEQLLKDM